MHRKRMICFVLVFMMVLGMAACGQSSTEKPGVSNSTIASAKPSEGKSANTSGSSGSDKIVFWDMYWGNTQYESLEQSLVDKYNEENDGPDIVLEMRPWATYYQDFLTAVMSGSAPDVATGPIDNSIHYGRMGELVDLSSIVDEWKTSGFYDTFPKGSVELHNVDGKQYGLPWVIDIRMLYYNIEMFKDAGVKIPDRGYFTFAELKDACAKLNKAGYVPMALPGLDFMNAQAMNYLLVAGDGNYGVDANFKAAVDAPRNKEIYNWLHSLVEEKLVAPESIGFTADQQIAMFASGECAMMIANMERVIDPKLYGTKYGVMTAPVWNESDPSRNIAYIDPIVVFSQTKYPEECKKFVKWWVENNGILFSEGEANFSASTKINSVPEMTGNPKYKMIMDKVFPNITYYVYPCTHLYNAVIPLGGENHMGHLFTELLMNQSSVDEIAEKYQAIVSQLVTENPEP